MTQSLDKEELEEMRMLARSRQSLLPKAYRDRLEELRRRHIDSMDDRGE